MSNTIASIIRSIPDSELARVRLTLMDGESIHLDCIYKEADAPAFFLAFPPNTIPENLDVKHPAAVTMRSEENPINISARIDSIVGDRTIELTAHDTIDPASLREYFRVMYKTNVRAYFEPENEESSLRPWQVHGESIDLSGTGMLGVFPKEFANRNNIGLEFSLPGLNIAIQCIAHVVRVKRLRRQRVQIALHFDNISRKERDAIITACLQEQRKQLRERLQTM